MMGPRRGLRARLDVSQGYQAASVAEVSMVLEATSIFVVTTGLFPATNQSYKSNLFNSPETYHEQPQLTIARQHLQ
jgi:hypothetical protein